MTARRRGAALALLLATGGLVLSAATWRGLGPAPAGLDAIAAAARRLQVLDRRDQPLNTTYANEWNLFETAALHDMPPLLVQAFVMAEDQHFFRHGGQDWGARCHALLQSAAAGRAVRGASTISEQVVRMLKPRARTLWSRWLEGWDAGRLERRYGKRAVLEFYLNQIPFAANRRGVVQAARYYFDRDLTTLNEGEMLALATLVRAPSRLDLYGPSPRDRQRAVARLAERMARRGRLGGAQRDAIEAGELALRRPRLAVDAAHFLRFVTEEGGGQAVGGRLLTSLDGAAQAEFQRLLDQRLQALARYRVHNAALLVADHRSGEILAWVVGGAGDDNVPGHYLDAVRVPRQPGSALKPFLYALALERGWTAATLIDDAPLAAAVGHGLHAFKNYSHHFNGPVTLRQALGNSLNIPALKTLQFVGIERYQDALLRLRLDTLSAAAAHYGEGLALGNGEVTLLALVQAYGALANRGQWRALTPYREDLRARPVERFVSPEVASLLGHILSDPQARRLEFGAASVLNFPVQAAVKTGTSSDHRDSWAIAYDARYVAGVWMGNLDQTPMLGVTGSTGPALVLRATLAWLNRYQRATGLWMSPRLQVAAVCVDGGAAVGARRGCPQRLEYFLPGTGPDPLAAAPGAAAPGAAAPEAAAPRAAAIRLSQPTPGLRLAMDPRLPATRQAFEFVLSGVGEGDAVTWRLDGGDAVRRRGARYLWPLAPGDHEVSAQVWRGGESIASIEPVRFHVH